MVAELVYHLHVPIETIAGLTDLQLRYLYFRDRNDDGRLKGFQDANDIPKVSASQRVSFESMYKHRLSNRGFKEEQVEGRWEEFVRKNPSIVKVLTKGRVRKLKGKVVPLSKRKK